MNRWVMLIVGWAALTITVMLVAAVVMAWLPAEHYPIECASSCSPHPMKSFEPRTGKCECQP